MVNTLGKAQGMDQCTTYVNSEVLGQDSIRQSQSDDMCPRMDNSQMVEHITINDLPSSSNTTLSPPSHLPHTRGCSYAGSTLGNPFFGGAGMTTMTELRKYLRIMECQQDIKPKVRIQWLEEAQHWCPNPKLKVHFKQAIQRIKRAGAGCKYPVFYNIEPLVCRAFEHINLHQVTTEALLDRLLLQVRLTTLMRSIDAANICWGLFTMESKDYLKTTDKTGQPLTFSITGQVVDTMKEYLHRHLQHPAMFLFRHTKTPSQCLGAERLAKRILTIMDQVGIQTKHFKAHSLRGAAATHLLKNKIPQDWIQARGHWSSSVTLDKYYNRLHQTKNWEALLMGRDEAVRLSEALAVPLPSSPIAETTKEVESMGDQGEGTARDSDLVAHGVLRGLMETILCPACGQVQTNEATYRCAECRRIYHVRCMGHYAAVGSRTWTYKVTCFLCSMALESRTRAEHPPNKDKLSKNKTPASLPSGEGGHALEHTCLIEDVMGVC